eukprot:TRINITY_DN2201_c0_g1_i1.p1 TRINITY_DN2201_c0_g1~~TRINITY_DN2201_c0_g1_i1.p1  ORF type:complete len:362 (-),score=75.30 TRINITY_DN2201_c0_g1_i1:17-1102(-)
MKFVLLLLLAVSTAVAADHFISASDPSVWSVGRTRQNSDGSLSFDWESTQFYINVQGATYVNAHIKANGKIVGRFIVQVNGWEQTSFWVGGANPGVTEFLAAGDLSGVSQIRIISVLEPSFEHANPTSFFTFVGFSTDGKELPANRTRTRKIELVGDSISAGYGSRGTVATHGCPVTGITSGNTYTYNWFLGEYFEADLVPIAWSGKGMYQNCCDNGETMPSYYLQTLGGESYSKDWDFTRFVPDILIINLGTNDFVHDGGPEWEAQFVATYVEFVANATLRYNNPKMPIFVAQGPMNCKDALRNSLEVVIAQVNSKGGNAHFLDVCGPPTDGCGDHPGVEGHRQMFEKAKPQIAAVTGWN